MPIDKQAEAEKVRGVVVPMVTPLDAQHEIETDSVHQLVRHLLEAHTAPFVLGTTGEAPSLSLRLKTRLVSETVKAAAGCMPVYAGISGNSLELSIDEGKRFADLGADFLVATPPGYYPLKSVQLLRYFEKLASSLPLPLILYNMPATTQCSLDVELIEKLSMHENIIGLKDSERSDERIVQLSGLFGGRNDFSLLIGWAARSVEALQAGYRGIVPSTANLIPEVYSQMVQAVANGHCTRAIKLQELTNQVGLLYQKGRILSESIPALKLLLSFKALCGPDVMPPMYRLEKDVEESIENEMKKILENSTE
ncbi:dihydrodipicolinate synthase family protein [Roseimarinus sediminis]|uniref:dihydrodipicolinate synthase family protein n=1 Tax=Roseimarinus sediminis TaxID=1610899 RepID=UPI003D1EDA81